MAIKNIILMIIFLQIVNFQAQAEEFKVYFKSEATDKRTNVVEPDVLFLNPHDVVKFNLKNVDIDKIVVLQIMPDGKFSEISKNQYLHLIDTQKLEFYERGLYLYYSKQYFNAGVVGLALLGKYTKKQAEALQKMNYNQNFKDHVAHLVKSLRPE